jgi:hypothetical protein
VCEWDRVAVKMRAGEECKAWGEREVKLEVCVVESGDQNEAGESQGRELDVDVDEELEV